MRSHVVATVMLHACNAVGCGVLSAVLVDLSRSSNCVQYGTSSAIIGARYDLPVVVSRVAAWHTRCLSHHASFASTDRHPCLSCSPRPATRSFALE